jgi:hypothetical protein
MGRSALLAALASRPHSSSDDGQCDVGSATGPTTFGCHFPATSLRQFATKTEIKYQKKKATGTTMMIDDDECTQEWTGPAQDGDSGME